MPDPARAVAAPEPQASTAAAFGLRLEVKAGVVIPGLNPTRAKGGGESAPGHATVRLDPEGLERRWRECGGGAKRMRELRQEEEVVFAVDLAEPAGYLLQAAGLGRVLVSGDGRELLCDPVPGCEDWAMILPTQALPLAATLQGFEVLHAAAAATEHGACLFSGPPGAGKSSLGAALLRRGAASLGDDAIALRPAAGGLLAYPGAGTVFLREAEQTRLTPAERDLLGAPERVNGGRWRYRAEMAPGPAPFGALFLLERAERGPLVEVVGGADPTALLASTFNLSVRTPERLARQLDFVGALAASGRIFRLRVLPGVDSTELAEAALEYLAGL
jgi:hypothetical protein